MKKALLILTLAMLPNAARASLVVLGATITPQQEIPPTTCCSNGSGTASVTIDTTTGFTLVDAFFNNLSSTVFGAAVYGPALIGQPGNLFLPLALVTPPALSGEFQGSIVLTAPQVAEFEGGEFYVEIFSQNFNSITETSITDLTAIPFIGVGGEIRGQIVGPEPSTLTLFGTAAALIALLRFRRSAPSLLDS